MIRAAILCLSAAALSACAGPAPSPQFTGDRGRDITVSQPVKPPKTGGPRPPGYYVEEITLPDGSKGRRVTIVEPPNRFKL